MLLEERVTTCKTEKKPKKTKRRSAFHFSKVKAIKQARMGKMSTSTSTSDLGGTSKSLEFQSTLISTSKEEAIHDIGGIFNRIDEGDDNMVNALQNSTPKK